MRIRSLCLLFTLGIVLVLPGAGRAETFYAYLSAAQEVPTNASTATGYARVFINETTGQLAFTVVYNGLTSAQNNSHIHAPAAIGASAAVAINFGISGGTSGTVSGVTTCTPTQLAQIRQHLGYVNVHSVNFPAGEIRGQLGIKRPVDFDGDGRQDMSVLKFPSIAPPGIAPITYWTANTTAGVLAVEWGDANTDFPAPGDYDGDGKDDYSLFRSGTTAGSQDAFWIYRTGTNTVQYYAWGIQGDQAVARDYDGDGITDVAVVRRGAVATDQLRWFIRNSATGTARVEGFGLSGTPTTNNSGDYPIPGDYDGDGKFDLAVYRAVLTPTNYFIINRSSDSVITYSPFGNFTTDYILPGDYDGDGKYDLAVGRTGATSTSPMVWWIVQSSTGTIRVQPFGISSDLPAQGDYDGDARADIAVYRRGATATAQSFFWVSRSFDGIATVTPWGLGADFAVNTFDAR